MSIKTSPFSNIKGDLSAGLVVFLIAVPLCLGIALASGAPLFSGMIAGIVGGIVIGAFSGSNLSVSGPAAGLTAIVLSAITQLGAFDIFLMAVVIGGALQLAFGFLKAGTVANYFPSNVITGMLTAIGIIIILKQIPHAFGYDADSEGDFAFFQVDGENSFTALLSTLNHIDIGATLITIISILIILYWGKIPKVKVVPAALVAVLAGIGINELFAAMGSSLAVSSKHLVSLPIASSFNEFLGQFTLPNFGSLASGEVWTVAFTIAIVASIETLLNVEATDKLDPLKRYTSPNRELKAQGIGNMVSGMIGGLPITSVIVRSSANINAGGRTKASTITHGILLLVCAALIPSLLNKIPLATLAAILLVTGYKLCKISVFKQMFQKGKYQWVPFMVTVVAIVFTNLLLGVALGLAVSVLAILRGNLKTPYFFTKSQEETGELKLELAQEVSFLNKANILLTLDHLPNNTTVILDASKTSYIDQDVLDIIREFAQIKAPQKQIKVILTGFKDVYKITNTDHMFIDQHNLSHDTVTNVKTGTHKELIKELTLN
ncbi:MFS superfamily sulfate permease-like transporter [Chitinophaga skermanii]|uniref:MFS superfamily sulfate permease-like transporter n=1 Tax=Chitinophaga skermanii TaxID=331697 RepID=A0A327QA00_9BACT|nr:SulP family inorganic anion transporter [Chitinophaga skermanii]RAI98636.1 MFS superfamily sulfate permease-like transporter [Chitinophaga skermanii]